MKKRILESKALQSLAASLICILVGVLIGYIVLLCINPEGASEAMAAILKNFWHYRTPSTQLRYFGNTLVKTAPLLMCALSIIFAYKVGLFNIGAAGQYTAGVCACLFAALAWGWGWLPCMLFAIAAGALVGFAVGVLKAYCNVNEVISGIMLNWIVLYATNMILTVVKEPTSPYTTEITKAAGQAILPAMGLDSLFGSNGYTTLAIPLAILAAIAVQVVFNKTKLGYELRATGNNKYAAKYSGMAEKYNILLTLAISGALAGLGAACFYQTGYEQWQCTASSVPAMGFNGIAAAFLGGLNPIGTIFSSYFIQHIIYGGGYLDMRLYSAQTSDLISAVIIYLCGFVLFIKYVISRCMDKSVRKKGKSGADEEGGVS